jgi:hypothetical protein
MNQPPVKARTVQFWLAIVFTVLGLAFLVILMGAIPSNPPLAIFPVGLLGFAVYQFVLYSKWADLQGLDPQYSQRLVGVDFSADPRSLAHDNKVFLKAIFLKSGRPSPGGSDVVKLKEILFQHWGAGENR